MWDKVGKNGRKIMSNMFLCGTSELSLDDKGRISIPVKYRKLLKDSNDGQCVITRSLFDPCLWLYPKAEWDEVVRSLAELNTFSDEVIRTIRRVLVGFSQPCALDSQGRILLSQELRNIVFLSKKAFLIGLDNKFEIWPESAMQERQEKDLGMLRELKEHLGDFKALDRLKI